MIVESRQQQELGAAYKAGTSVNRNAYQRNRKKKLSRKVDLGPPAIIILAEPGHEELFIYDRFGRKKKF